mgnify:CR=1 FL=1
MSCGVTKFSILSGDIAMEKENIYQAPSSVLDRGEEEEVVYAGFWVRVIASIIDTVILLLVSSPLLLLIYGKNYWVSDSFSKGFWDYIISYAFPAIAIILFWHYKSATPGKMLLGLKIVSLGTTQQLSVGQSIGRYLAYFPSMFVFMIGIIWVAFDRRKQGWHDKLANTVVIKSR